MKTCGLDGCERKHYASGLCNMHWQRKRKTGTTDPSKRMAPRGANAVEVLDHHGWTVTGTGCWEFNGPREVQGYGLYTISGVAHKAHRVAYERTRGPIPDGLVVRHRCDNPPCVNPDHLESGTKTDNANDREQRGRSGVARLTETQVIEIRQRYLNGNETLASLGKEYGVSFQNIGRIIARNSWAWVNV